jgi:hypothetical protein
VYLGHLADNTHFVAVMESVIFFFLGSNYKSVGRFLINNQVLLASNSIVRSKSDHHKCVVLYDVFALCVIDCT